MIKCEIFLNEWRSCEVLWGLCGQGNLNQAMFCGRACRGFNGPVLRHAIDKSSQYFCKVRDMGNHLQFLELL